MEQNSNPIWHTYANTVAWLEPTLFFLSAPKLNSRKGDRMELNECSTNTEESSASSCLYTSQAALFGNQA